MVTKEVSGFTGVNLKTEMERPGISVVPDVVLEGRFISLTRPKSDCSSARNISQRVAPLHGRFSSENVTCRAASS